ncbi:GerMN domain-containing protein [Sutcliffiella cohnii]|uniref:GerMN domain-containing protein n=1 Tax=Sutcliffiella cohnii TaxID=33932 RepID=UPI002E1EC8C2|nr:GerMN domain-containing protein [Sutcliffiella cohnii]
MHRKTDDEQMEKLFNQLPKMTDERSAEEIYANIQHKVETSSKRRINWMPSVALIAAILLFAIISPFMFQKMDSVNNSAFDAPKDRGGSMEMYGDDSSADIAVEEESFNITEYKESNENESFDIQTTSDFPNYVVTTVSQPDEYVITLAVSAELEGTDDPLTLPISFVVQRNNRTYIEAFNELRQQLENLIDLPSYGLMNTMLNDNITFSQGSATDGNDRVIMEMNAGHRAYSSTQMNAFFQEVQETFRWHNFTEVEYLNEGKAGVEIGNDVKEFDLIDTFKRVAYFKFQRNDDVSKSLLVASKEEFQSMQEAVEAMSQIPNINYVFPSIPASMRVDQVITNDEEMVTISFDNSLALENTEEHSTALQALMLTARDFGFEQIQFNYPNADMIGSIRLNVPLSVPLAANPMN